LDAVDPAGPERRQAVRGVVDLSPLLFGYRNCTDYAAWEINEELGGVSADGPFKFTWSSIESGGHGNAADWEQGAIEHYGASSVNEIPTVGSVAWWGTVAHGLGHVAVVTSVSNNGSTIQIDEYNALITGGYDSQSLTYNPTTKRIASPNGTTWPDAFTHIPGTTPPTPPAKPAPDTYPVPFTQFCAALGCQLKNGPQSRPGSPFYGQPLPFTPHANTYID